MIIEVDDVDVFLEHHGVKGQKWGIRNQRARISRNHALNKASRAKDKAAPPSFTPKKAEPVFGTPEYRRQIDEARKKINSGKADHEVKLAKFNHKSNKAKLGSREAKKILKAAKHKYANTAETASQVRDGKELTLKIISDLTDQLHEERAARKEAESKNQSQQSK